jgi:hypothetical protein
VKWFHSSNVLARTNMIITDCYFPNSIRLNFLFTIQYIAISESRIRLVKCYSECFYGPISENNAK